MVFHVHAQHVCIVQWKIESTMHEIRDRKYFLLFIIFNNAQK